MHLYILDIVFTIGHSSLNKIITIFIGYNHTQQTYVYKYNNQ